MQATLWLIVLLLALLAMWGHSQGHLGAALNELAK